MPFGRDVSSAFAVTDFPSGQFRATFRRSLWLSPTQLSQISRFEVKVASLDYATVFVRGIPLIDETRPFPSRDFAYWNKAVEFGKLLVTSDGELVIAAQLVAPERAFLDIELDAILFDGQKANFET